MCRNIRVLANFDPPATEGEQEKAAPHHVLGIRSFAARAALCAAFCIVAPARIASAQNAQDRPVGTVVVSNMNDHTATVLDAATGRVLATLPTGRGPHEVAISRDGRWAFVTLQGRNRVITIDLYSARILSWAPTGTWSDGIGYSPLDTAPR